MLDILRMYVLVYGEVIVKTLKSICIEYEVHVCTYILRTYVCIILMIDTLCLIFFQSTILDVIHPLFWILWCIRMYIHTYVRAYECSNLVIAVYIRTYVRSVERELSASLTGSCMLAPVSENQSQNVRSC